jgi:hypothetical protein
MKMITTRSELLAYLDSIGYNKQKYRIAVEGLIFRSDGRLLLEKRGPQCRDEIGKLEGVGGSLGTAENLLQKLHEEFEQELAAKNVGLEIAIDRLLEVRQVQFEEAGRGWLDWVVVSYLCRIIKGVPDIGEKGKIASLEYLTLDQLYAMPEDDLSKSTVSARQIYAAKYGNRPYYEVPDKEMR